MHRDPDEQVAAAADRRAEPLALAAHDDGHRAAEVRLACGERRVAVRAHDPQAPAVEVRERGGKIVDR
jgi:hypothetical protein